MPAIRGQSTGGLLDPSLTTLTLNQRRTMQNLLSQGIAPNVARNLAIALTKSAAVPVAKKSYHQAFSEAAKEILPDALSRRLHMRARAIAGGYGKAARRREDAMTEDAESFQLEKKTLLEKADGLTPPKGVQSACKRGLELAPEYGGAGLTDGAKARARSMASGNAVSLDQLRRMHSFFSRHDSYEKEASPPSPGYVSWLLWGGDAGKSWAQSKKDSVEKTAPTPAYRARAALAIAKGQKPIGAAFARARATGKKQDHESRKRRANAYLESQGHKKIGKSAPQLQDVRAEAFLRLVRDRKKKKTTETTKAEQVPVQMRSLIVKAEQQEWQRLVWSVVYEPDTVDLHGDFMDASTIQKAAHDAMRSGIYINSEHRGDPLNAEVVESYTAPCDFTLATGEGDVTVTKGSWVQCLHIKDDAHWQGVLDGTYTGFSLEGMALAAAA